MNKDLTEVYAGKTVYDDKQWADKQLERLQCSNSWSVKRVKVEPEVKVNCADILEEKKNELRSLLNELPKDEDSENIRKKTNAYLWAFNN